MKNLYFNVVGTGNINLVLLSGWGLDTKIWFSMIEKLNHIFKFYLIDLPGYGKNKNLSLMTIDEIINILHRLIPKKSIWLGWSIGGLIASLFALSHPEYTLAVISVASSPCFIEKEKWPGIKKNTIYYLYKNLKKHYYKTIKNFLNWQIINTKNNIQDLIILKNILYSQSKPNVLTLKNGLEMIFSIDLRLDMMSLKIPVLRIYGALDSLVPKKIAKILDQAWPNTNSIILKHAAHAPFISHEEEFFSILLNFKKTL